MYQHYLTRNLGVNYKGPWIHPLTPYFIADDGSPSALHPQPGGMGYRYWLGLIQTAQGNKGKRQPARIVEHFIRERRRDLRLWAFGYDMDNMKARCWYDSMMPLILTDENIRKSYEYHTAALVQSADQVSRETRRQVKRALFKPENEVKGDLSFIELRFWQETEADFFNSLRQLRDALTVGRDIVPILEDWHKRLVREAEVIFNDISQTGSFDAADPKRIALAWLDVRKGIYSKKLREQLGLPVKTGAS
jgi:CRISPR system Cascade subunit CasA